MYLDRIRGNSVVTSDHCMNDPQKEGHMASHIGRRRFLAALGGAAACPFAALAERPKVPTIGALVIGNISPEEFWREFRQGLRDLGYIEGQNIRFERGLDDSENLNTTSHGSGTPPLDSSPLSPQRKTAPCARPARRKDDCRFYPPHLSGPCTSPVV